MLRMSKTKCRFGEMTSAFRSRVTARDWLRGPAHLQLLSPRQLSRCLAAVTSLRFLQREYRVVRRLGAEWKTMTDDAWYSLHAMRILAVVRERSSLSVAAHTNTLSAVNCHTFFIARHFYKAMCPLVQWS